jgi:hypothetical protein
MLNGAPRTQNHDLVAAAERVVARLRSCTAQLTGLELIHVVEKNKDARDNASVNPSL